MGIPTGGFPEPFRTNVLKGRTLPNGKDRLEGRPGAEMLPLDFAKVRAWRARPRINNNRIVRRCDLFVCVCISGGVM